MQLSIAPILLQEHREAWGPEVEARTGKPEVGGGTIGREMVGGES